MSAKIRKGDLVEVVRGRNAEGKALDARNARRAAEGLEPLKPGDKVWCTVTDADEYDLWAEKRD